MKFAKSKTLLAACLFVSSNPAAAMETVCRFNTECFEGEDCTSTEYDVTITADPEAESGLVLQTGSETLRGTGIRKDGPGHTIFVGDTALHVISASDNGTARYTVHLEGPMTITYQGTCEVME
ncbi:hypothetical protein [Marivita sp.]|uniref:hypothetical protein n=1 Tax=Marivita sp. TaxID=2003365 RepID=UPI003F6B10CD